MIILALIPFTVFVAVLVICVRAKHDHTATVAKLSAKAEAVRQEKLVNDESNDKRLITGIIDGSAGVGELVANYRGDRAAILPGSRCSDAAAWVGKDLSRFCHEWRSSRITAAMHKSMLGASLKVLAVVVIGVVVACYRYSELSGTSAAQTSPVIELPDDDPFASTSAN